MEGLRDSGKCPAVWVVDSPPLCPKTVLRLLWALTLSRGSEAAEGMGQSTRKAGNTPQFGPCPNFISITMMKSPSQKRLRYERVYWGAVHRSKGSQGRNLK